MTATINATPKNLPMSAWVRLPSLNEWAPGRARIRSRRVARVRPRVQSHSPKPRIALILPIPARPFGGERQRHEVLRHLVAELGRRIEPQRRAMRGWERIVVHPIRENRLRMHRAREIPAVGIAG